MIADLDRIDWHSLLHAYGPADDGPGTVRAAASDDPDTGDLRWRAPLLRTRRNGLSAYLATETFQHLPIPADDEIVAAVRSRLVAVEDASMTANNERIFLVIRLRAWGPAAAPAIPELLAVADRVTLAVPQALTAIGAAAASAVPTLRAASEHNPAAAEAVFHLSGDPSPLVSAIANRLDEGTCYDVDLQRLAAVGDAARPLLPRLLALLDGRPSSERVAAAAIAWSLTGEAEAVLPALAAALDAGRWPAAAAADLAGRMGVAAPLTPHLRRALADPFAKVAAAQALWLLGEEREPLTETLLAEIGDVPRLAIPAVDVLLRMRAVSVAPRLQALAGQDERLITSGTADDIVIGDESLRTRLREAAAELAP